MERLLRTSLLPVGQTMYIWGGGWNQDDAGAGIEAVTLGVSKRWAEYAAWRHVAGAIWCRETTDRVIYAVWKGMSG